MGRTPEQVNPQSPAISEPKAEVKSLDIFSRIPVSRRRALQVGATVLSAAIFAEACGAQQGQATIKPGESFPPSPSPIVTQGEMPSLSPSTTTYPSESGRPIVVETINGSLLTQAFSNIEDSTKINIQTENGTVSKTAKDLAVLTSQTWNKDAIDTSNLSRNGTVALEFALTAADLSGKDGLIDLSAIFPGLSVKLARLNLADLPNGQNNESASNAFPKNINVKSGMNLIVVGINDSTNQALVAFEDTVRKANKAPTMYFGVLPVDGQNQDGTLSLQGLLSGNGASYDSKIHSIKYQSNVIAVNSVDSSLTSGITQEAGAYFVDFDPLKKNKDGTKAFAQNPIVSAPPVDQAPQGSQIEQLNDGRVVAVDSNNQPLTRAANFGGEWTWVNQKEFVQDYTPRELADAEGVSISTFADINYLQDPQFSTTAEAVANKLTIATELDQSIVFGNFQASDWKNILANWSTIQKQLDKGILPSGFNYNWNLADRMINFAQTNNMQIKAQHLLAGGDDAPESVVNGKFSSADLTKILEFMVKTRVINYKGVINEWEGASETFTINAYGSDIQKFWYTKLGEGVVGKVFQWAHQANPSATLNITEDHVLDPDNPQVTQGYLALLQQLKQQHVPVDTAVIENNMWLYTPPNKNQMIQILNQIKNMGYKIGPSETTVSVSDHDPLYQDRQKLVTVTNKDKAQAKIYSDLLDAYLTVGNQFGLGGITDAVSWFNNIGHPEADAMIFDSNFQPKPAYFALLDVLKSHLNKG